MTDQLLTLNTAGHMPALGLGTWKAEPGVVADAVEHALVKVGIRHIDGAYYYENETEVGEGIKRALDSGIKREDIFVTTKVWPTFHKRVEESLNHSLKELGLDYVDLLLVHWPLGLVPNNKDLVPRNADGSAAIDPSFDIHENWKQFEAVYAKGKAKFIGVSNYSELNLQKLLSKASIVPVCNQIELHPLLPQHELVEYCRDHNIVVTAWSPLAGLDKRLHESEAVQGIARKHKTNSVVVCLSWHVSKGRCVIPKSVKKERIESNAQIVKLDDEDLDLLDNLWKTTGIVRTGANDWAAGQVHFADWD